MKRRAAEEAMKTRLKKEVDVEKEDEDVKLKDEEQQLDEVKALVVEEDEAKEGIRPAIKEEKTGGSCHDNRLNHFHGNYTQPESCFCYFTSLLIFFKEFKP